jgi:hypothetical protein
MTGNEKILLVGDNPFHSISHLSQDRARERDNPAQPERAADLIALSVDNGATGFMFSVSETTLSILRALRRRGRISDVSLYSIVPYAYEYVRLATVAGGLPGLAKRIAKQMVTSVNVRAIAAGLEGIVKTDAVSFMKAYMAYEISRMRSAAGNEANLRAVLLHETITDMFLALDLDRFFREYVAFMRALDIIPGFNTGNFAYLVDKFGAWNLSLQDVVVAAPFNKVGFQMIPSKIECESALERASGSTVLAISILAAGYLKPPEAIEYLASLPNLSGVAVGVSKELHARETFKLLKEW